MKVAVIFDNFGPYHIARLRAAAKRLDLIAIEGFGTSYDYAWQPLAAKDLNRRTLFPDAIRELGTKEYGARLEHALEHSGIDVLAIPGWSARETYPALTWCKRAGVAAIVMSDSTEWDSSRSFWKEAIKRRIIALFSSALVGGIPHRDYAVRLGMPESSVFLGYDTVDNDYFSHGADAARKAGPALLNSPDAQGPCEELSSEWQGRYFVATARFVPKKNLARLIEAFALYRQAAGPGAWPLVLLGDGPMREELERKRAALGLEALLVMPGFKQYGELPLYYGAAGAFVHASTTEQWGLVVNEAMASGLPVLVSERCGCATDLVENGRNGYTFDPDNADALAALMLKVASDGCDRVAMGKASREIIDRWSPETFAKGLQQAAEVALRATPRQFGLLDRALLWMLSHR